jgi:hypothetical protein
MALHPAFAFFRNYVLRAGFKDGRVGFIVSVLNSYYVFLKLAKLWERQRAHPRLRQGSGGQAAPGPPPTG